jgi:hypothetical protein
MGFEKMLPGFCKVLGLHTQHYQSLETAVTNIGYLKVNVFHTEFCNDILIMDFVSKTKVHALPSLNSRHFEVIFFLRRQCGEYIIAKYSFLTYTFIFCEQFYLVSSLKIIDPGNPNNNLESSYIRFS